METRKLGRPLHLRFNAPELNERPNFQDRSYPIIDLRDANMFVVNPTTDSSNSYCLELKKVNATIKSSPRCDLSGSTKRYEERRCELKACRSLVICAFCDRSDSCFSGLAPIWHPLFFSVFRNLMQCGHPAKICRNGPLIRLNLRADASYIA